MRELVLDRLLGALPDLVDRHAVEHLLEEARHDQTLGLRAIDAICSHAHYYLDEGDVDTDFETIECPKHGSSFDLNSGKPRSLPATTPVDVFPITTEDDDIYIEV